jgi:hypothetical protein
MWVWIIIAIAVAIGVRFLLNQKAEKSERLGNEYIQNLTASGFQITKQVLLADFLPKIKKQHAFVLGVKMGIFVDYNAKKLAIRSSDTTTPAIMSFSELQDYGLLEGKKVVSTGGSFTGYTAKGMADNLSVRVSFGGGTSGVNAVKIPLYFQNNTGIKLDTNSPMYQACLDCARAIMDELGNITKLA